MEAYRLYNVVPQLFDFIEDLTNWYIRLNRSRYWGEENTPDKSAAYQTLYTALLELSQVMAPFTPFLSEYLYGQLASLAGTAGEYPQSVHLCAYPKADESLIRSDLETAVDRMQQVILLGRQKREEKKIGLRTPLASLTVVSRDSGLLDDMRVLESYLRDELNVREVRYDSNESAYIELVAKPNFKLLGKRLGKRMKAFQQAIRSLDDEQIGKLQREGKIILEGEVFTSEEIEVLQQARPGTNTVSNARIAVDLDCELTPTLIRGGYAREIVNRIQRSRKELGLEVSDRIEVVYAAEGDLAVAAKEYSDYIAGEVLATSFVAGETDQLAAQIDGMQLRFSIRKVS
jgi:isoleucyl-tRNA synthetase